MMHHGMVGTTPYRTVVAGTVRNNIAAVWNSIQVLETSRKEHYCRAIM